MNYLLAITPSARRIVLEYARRTKDVEMAAALAVARFDRACRALAPVGTVGGNPGRRYVDHYHGEDVDSMEELAAQWDKIRVDVRKLHGQTVTAIQEALG